MSTEKKAALQSELEALAERQAAIRAELVALESESNSKVLRLSFFNTLPAAEQMETIKAGIKLIDG